MLSSTTIRRKDSLLYQVLNMPRVVAYFIVLLGFVKIVGGILDSDSFWEFLWCGLFLTGLRMLNHLDHLRFAFLAGFTLLTQLAGQAMLNIAVVTAMVPPKGISHPLISAGGSSLIVSLFAIGIVLSLSREGSDTDSEIETIIPAS